MLKKYIYPALLTYRDDGTILASFPDFPDCFISTTTLPAVMDGAKSLLSVCLSHMASTHQDIPVPTDPRTMEFNHPNEFGAFIEVTSDDQWIETVSKTFETDEEGERIFYDLVDADEIKRETAKI